MNRLKLSAAALLLAFGIPALAAVPQVSPEMKANAETMWQDAVSQKMYDELKSEEGQKWRFNTLMELVRIASRRPRASNFAASRRSRSAL